MRLLLIEDDLLLARGIAEALSAHGHDVESLGAAEPADAVLRTTAYDLVILDIGLPKMDGFSLLRRLRERGLDVPVLVLTARDAVEDRVQGLNLGADDYLVKPFALQELVARCQALLRRGRSASSQLVRFGGLTVDLGRQQATQGDAPLPLTPREWALLEHLMLAAPNVVSKARLVDGLSRWDREITSNAIEIYASRLRTKLASAGVTLRAVRGIGYRLEASAEPGPESPGHRPAEDGDVPR